MNISDEDIRAHYPQYACTNTYMYVAMSYCYGYGLTFRYQLAAIT